MKRVFSERANRWTQTFKRRGAHVLSRVLSRPMALLGLVVLMGGLSVASGCGDEEKGDPCDPINAVTLTVTYEGSSQDVFLGDLTGEPDGDLCLVTLADVVSAADTLVIDLQTTAFDFEASDGFRPTSVGCPRVAGTDLSSGWVDENTGTLVWDDALGFEGCHYVRDVVTLDASDLP